MNEQKFNRYCAEVMGYKIYTPTPYREGVIVHPTYEKEGETIGLTSTYDPYNDLNQLAPVVEKLLHREEAPITFDNLMECLNCYPTVLQAFRDFVEATR